MFLPDQPIASHKEDLLGRYNFAKYLSAAIIKYNQTESVSIGLFGEWGSGKTSIINMVLEEIEKSEVNLTDQNPPIIVKFNPWNFSDQKQLISQFFSELSAAVSRNDKGKQYSKLGGKIKQYAGLFEPLKYVPVFSAAGEAAKAIKTLGEATEKAGENIAKDLSGIKKELTDLLRDLKRKIIIVIDDIDRLNNTEIRQTFQLVKSLADFPNTLYFLSFDKNVVINALKKVQEGSGSEYLDKVIQVPFEIPKHSKIEIEHLLFSQIGSVIGNINSENWDQRYWGNLYHSGIKYLFLNIRHVNRFINTLRFNFELVKDEVNVVDFISITAIQIFLPEIYYEIRDNEDVFSGLLRSDYGSGESIKKSYKEKCDSILSQLESDRISKEQLLDFLKRLFPKVRSIYENHGYSGSFLETWRKELKICSPDKFETYFCLSISADDISQKELQSIINCVSDKIAFKEHLLILHKNGKITQFLKLFQDYTEKEIPKEDIKNIISVLMDIGDLFPEGETGFYSFGNDVQLSRIFYQLSKRLKSQEDRYEIFRESIENATNSLHTIVHEISGQMDEHGEYKADKQLEPEETRAISAKQLSSLKKLTKFKIREWADEGKLISHRKFVSIIYLWKRIDDEKVVSDYIIQIIKTDQGLVDFIESFLSQINSHVIDDYVSISNWKINLDNITDFVDIDQIESRSREVLSSDDFNKLSEKEQLAVNKLIDTIDGKEDSRF
jgi:predicted KAP-like P-loop ATPase